ncbi:UTRA domain-containing protein [Microvirga tunisiensis]|uniref:UTRA domain-containing protein n=1 Tax=Pannonibacter tanglangensis TaxID=2750084 RepID=A0A7X5F0S1_9HYPH|nr:GntR family transcriptional regulator [Pannonibacter sp. XCT-53]NBN77608.1 UTRA domain-containing protein [Pannonibacter sp. XCT-53]
MPRPLPGPVSWQAIQAEALRRIRDREWKPGSLIPHEAQLAAEFGCARATVNRALRELADLGLLERRRKAGTRVPLNPVRRATFQIPIIRQDIEGRGAAYDYRRLGQAVEPAPEAVSALLELAPGQELLHVTALHRADGIAFCHEDRWINLAVPGLETADFSVTSPNEWLVQNTAYSSGSIEFFAAEADGAMAALFGCRPGAALFVMDRSTWAGPLAITAVRLTYAPGHRLTTEI